MRFATVVTAAAVALASAGCNEPCKSENVDVVQDTVPASCPGMAAGAPVTVSFEVCVRCNEATPTCRVDAQPGGILLDPMAEACESGASCPLPSCGAGGADLRTVSCAFTAPASDVTLHVYDVGQGTTIDVPLTVGGSSTSCG
jgi:hypothetical protein